LRQDREQAPREVGHDQPELLHLPDLRLLGVDRQDHGMGVLDDAHGGTESRGCVDDDDLRVRQQRSNGVGQVCS
jgi:hypothetical protein